MSEHRDKTEMDRAERTPCSHCQYLSEVGESSARTGDRQEEHDSIARLISRCGVLNTPANMSFEGSQCFFKVAMATASLLLIMAWERRRGVDEEVT